MDMAARSIGSVVHFPGSWTDVDPRTVLATSAELGLEGIMTDPVGIDAFAVHNDRGPQSAAGILVDKNHVAAAIGTFPSTLASTPDLSAATVSRESQRCSARAP